MAVVLMFNIHDPEKVSLLQVLSIRLNYTCRVIDQAEQCCRISDLLNGSAHASHSRRLFHDEMLVLEGFSHTDLNFLLNELIRTGNTIRLKAVTTPTNRRWTVSMLHAQLVAESDGMAGRSV